jgi:hypothetical protein
MAIVLQFVQGTGFGAALIKFYDHGLYSHVDSVLPDGTLLGARDDEVGGMPSGVQRITLPCTDAQADAYYAFVRSQIGKAYDETAIVAFAVGRDWRTPDCWFCSELCAAGLEASGFVFPLSSPANKVAPDDLLMVVSALVKL